MLIKLGEGVWVTVTAVVQIDVPAHHNVIDVTLSNGAKYSVGADYGKGIHETANLLVAEINAALTGGKGDD